MKELSPSEKHKANTKKGWAVVAVLFLLLTFITCGTCVILSDDDATNPATVTTPQNKWEEWQAKYVSAWDGSCRPVEQLIKKNLNDPESYQHAATNYYLNADTSVITVITDFRAKNGFGGLILTKYSATVGIDGTVLTIQQVEL